MNGEEGSLRRIVSLVPSLTETLFDLSLGDRVVGVTRYCVEPATAVAALPKLGGTKNPKREEILALSPDLVFVNAEENRQEDIDWLTERCEVFVTMPRTLPEVVSMLRELGVRLACEAEAEPIAAAIETEQARVAAAGGGQTPVRVFMPIWKKPWMSCNRDTYVHHLLEAAGAVNVCAHEPDRYPVVTEDALAGLRTDLVMLPSEPYAFGPEHRDELRASGLFPGCSILLVDGQDCTWHGSRTASALARLAALIDEHRPT